MSPFNAALKGSREIGFTILSITVSLCAVFIPVLLMGGVVGRIFNEFAMVVTIAIMASALVSLTLTPMLGGAPARGTPATPARRNPVRARLRPRARGLSSALRPVPALPARDGMAFVASAALTVHMFIDHPEGLLPNRRHRTAQHHHGGAPGHLVLRRWASCSARPNRSCDGRRRWRTWSRASARQGSATASTRAASS